METKKGDHALEINPALCGGCAHCMRVCPTEAIRVFGGKALMFPDWCVDCGECYRVCPAHAIQMADDDMNKLFDYKYRVLLIPALFFGQFATQISMKEISGFLCDLGFNEVCAVEQSADLLPLELNRYLCDHPKPVISSFCPSVVRLIQMRFPLLTDHIMQLIPPLEVTAQYCKRSFEAKGIPSQDLGIFYVTPCAAKIAAIKAPVGGYTSPINGVINMKNLYNKVYLAFKHKKIRSAPEEPDKLHATLSATGIRWSMTGGESVHIKGRALAIDGMTNVLAFLEKLENEEITGIDFLELRACDESCAGGILTSGNRFLTVEHLKQMAHEAPKEHTLVHEYRTYCSARVPMQPVAPRSMVKFDTNMKVALEKMDKARRLRALLPGIDCGACGTPSCEALAEDIVCRDASLHACVFMKTRDPAIMEKIWGKRLFPIKRK